MTFSDIGLDVGWSGDFGFDAPEDNRSSPERRLIMAVIERAARDYIGGSAVDQSSAKDWIFDRDDQDIMVPFTFEWCCDQLAIRPETVRIGIERTRKLSLAGTLPFYLDKRFQLPPSQRVINKTAA